MSKEVLMPQYGLTMEEGAVERWLVKVGDTVKKGDVLAEIATDKLTNDLVSEVEGTVLQLVAKEGVDLPVKAVLAVIGEPGEAMGAAPSQAAPAADKPAAPEQAPEPAAAPAAKAAPGGRVKVSPFARKLAEKGNVDVSALAGSGPGGRVVA
ncbi:MAG TPA: biotin/lipoyl-containing protein, partial [Candidatus Limnocylindria bacterium]|nr:biotin/lipoyl-containing protein [Candidatus Limnocylindria bacterium]